MADVVIKPDPEAAGASSSAFAEDDIYEDAGDLEFNTDPKYQKLYLARLPKYIWDNWHNLDDDAEILLGTIRQSHVTDSEGNPQV
jgi:transcription initiation factor TFIIF subunit beta